ncbi:MAG: hypothetical protein MRERV_4c092 [Mycoplasmataceae bacterium RV_VA103A]|nr:MAG: hypothetical protein MRERV_11c048 [Mycoplasmataceae bacterium RV_VA103A]KLL05183.1 MAG: hypothetical protein MRERV_4c092 [Mycoplasmataceae bacterium RV_VA103A]
MPLFEENQKTNNQNQSDRTQQTTTNNSQDQKKSSGLITAIGTFLPFAPLVWEQFTGQKVPALTGTVAEIQTALQQLQLTHAQILNNQNQIWTKIENLEKNASNQLTNLTQQFQSLRLTHTREKKQIEYNNPPRLEEETE